MLICTLGDLLLDVVVRLDGAIEPDTDAFGRTYVAGGGQAANVAAWTNALGGRARVLAKRARDPAGRIVAEELRARGVELLGPETNAGTGTVVSLATRDGARAMLTDRGVSPELAPDELQPAWLEGCDWLYVSGYSLARSPLAETAIAAAQLAPRVALDVGSTAAVRQVGVERFRARVGELRPTLVLATEAEEALAGPFAAERVVVKRGARGCVVRSDGAEREYAARAAELVDATGAGDAFAAGFLLGGPELAVEAAARCVARMGAMPE